MAEAKTKWQYEVTGYDKEGRKVFHVLVEAVNSDVAKLYARAHLERTVDWRGGREKGGQDQSNPQGHNNFAIATSPPMRNVAVMPMATIQLLRLW